MNVARIGRLLQAANTQPHGVFGDKDQFYAMKEGICKQFGKIDDKHDVQKIRKVCWDCGGAGDDGFGWAGGCCRCGDTGTYEVIYVKLERWIVGDCVFHRPAGRIDRPHTGANIDGLIKHKARRGWRASGIALARIFNESLYWKALQVSPRNGFGRMVNHSARLAKWAAPELFTFANTPDF